MNIRKSYRATIYACYLAYIVQGIINNISPILFVSYQQTLGISIEKIGILIAVNFGVQILVDFASAGLVDRVGVRESMIFAHVLTVIGTAGIGLLPLIMPDPFIGLIIATILNAIGGGLLEVLVSPTVEAAPGEDKEKAMSMLHSFYCWGCVGFVLLSTLMLHFFKGGSWIYVPIIWAAVPVVNIFLFGLVPINQLVADEERVPIVSILKMRSFRIFVILMICAGASEMAMSQWASYFAEIGLNVSKTTGNLLGPCAFSLLMGLSRLFYGKMGHRIELKKFIILSAILCIISYLTAVLSPVSIISLIGCALCGLSVGIMWPGTYSLAAKDCKAGGTAVFSFLALAGDIGCVSGPEVVNSISAAFPSFGIKAGLAAAVVFPVILLITIISAVKEN